MPNLNFFQMAKIRPEIKIFGRFLVSGHKIYIIPAKKIFGQNAQNFGSPATSKVKIFEKTLQNDKNENFSKGQISARNRNFWPIFGFRPEDIYFSGQKILGVNSSLFRTFITFQLKIAVKNKPKITFFC